MNERIRLLAEQAGYLPDSFGVGHWDMPECKKFAELIVQECMNVVADCKGTMKLEHWSAIKEHFGVEQ